MKIMLEEGFSVLADKGYPSAKNSLVLEFKNLVNKIMKKASKGLSRISVLPVSTFFR